MELTLLPDGSKRIVRAKQRRYGLFYFEDESGKPGKVLEDVIMVCSPVGGQDGN